MIEYAMKHLHSYYPQLADIKISLEMKKQIYSCEAAVNK